MVEKKFFRYPYLAEGQGERKRMVYDYLYSQDYIIAPVTIDTKDFEFNTRLYNIPWRQRPNHLSRIKKEYLNYILKQTLKAEKRHPLDKQILLIHANLLNSHFMADIIDLYKQNGYEFITLSEAISRPILESNIPKISYSYGHR